MTRWPVPTLDEIGELAVQERGFELALRDLRRTFPKCTMYDDPDPHNIDIFGQAHDGSKCPGCRAKEGPRHARAKADLRNCRRRLRALVNRRIKGTP